MLFICASQDLDPALPLIEQYKEQIVAIGEVRHTVWCSHKYAATFTTDSTSLRIRVQKTACVLQVGLDFTPRVVTSDVGKESQRQVLIRQAEIAMQLNLPL